MRLAPLFRKAGLALVMTIPGIAHADEPFPNVAIRSQPVYIVPEAYGRSHRADFLASLTDFHTKIDFWTPTEDQVRVAERAFRDWIRSGVDDPGKVIPDMARFPERYSASDIANEKSELTLVDKNIDAYSRQFAAILVDGRKVILCNYTIVPGTHPELDYIFIQKTFAEKQGMHFLQGQYDPETRQCSGLAMVGLWGTSGKKP